MATAEKRFEIPTSMEHSPKEIERALSHFIDPENPKMSYRLFAEELITASVGLGEGDLSEYDEALSKGILSVLEDVKDARRFDASYIGHMLSEASVPGLVGAMIAMRLGSNTVSEEVSKKETALEPEAIRGLISIVGYDPEKASGTFTSGGTLANMTALAVARSCLEIKHEVAQHGLPEEERTNIDEVQVLTIPQAHYSIPKAIDLLGGPDKTIKRVLVETKGLRMSTEDLERKIIQAKNAGVPVMAIVAIAGETETGLVDSLEEIAYLGERYGIFTIADGAYGAPYRLSKKADCFRGLERFDAVTIDGHKAFYTPYSNGAVLFKDANNHALLSMGIEASYLGSDVGGKSPEEFAKDLVAGKAPLSLKRIEGSAGAGPILSTVAVLRTLGQEGLATVYDLTLDRTARLYQRVEASPYLRAIHEPELNLLCFTLSEEAEKMLGITNNDQREEFITQARLELDNGVVGEGGYFFSSTNLPLDEKDHKGGQVRHYVWRACIMNPRTTDEIIDEAVRSLEGIIKEGIQSFN